MGHAYQAVGWNRQKRLYDAWMVLGSLAYVILFAGTSAWLFPDATAETLLIRGLGSAAFILLHVILCIGPLHRLAPITAPLLYNRRHLGVWMFTLALAHAVLTTVQFHVLGSLNPLVSILSGGGSASFVGLVPFQIFGLAALLILSLMAATSHDFWLSRLSPGTWKRLHMSVYLAYTLLVAHVAFGIGHQPGSGLWMAALVCGVLLVTTLHLVAGVRERDRRSDVSGDWVRVGPAAGIAEGRAQIVATAGDRVAVFRHEGELRAISNTCRHQGGPLGEGRILNGCVVCPWHGYEYDPVTGCAPSPFTERVPTFSVRVVDGDVFVSALPTANAESLEGSHG